MPLWDRFEKRGKSNQDLDRKLFFSLSLSSKDFLLLKDLKNGLFLLMKSKMLLGKYLEIEH